MDITILIPPDDLTADAVMARAVQMGSTPSTMVLFGVRWRGVPQAAIVQPDGVTCIIVRLTEDNPADARIIHRLRRDALAWPLYYVTAADPFYWN